MPKYKDANSIIKWQHLGQVYRLIEQFDLISRIDLSKLLSLAPATITQLTRELIHCNLIIERTTQATEHRGRPAIGLCVSPYYWQTLCANLRDDSFELSLCNLTGELLAEKTYSFTDLNPTQIELFLTNAVQNFLDENNTTQTKLLTFSIMVVGEVNNGQANVTIADKNVKIDFIRLFQPHLSIPILVNEYFYTWLLAEASLGVAINRQNVLFIQLDNEINLNLLHNGQFWHAQCKHKMKIDQLLVPPTEWLPELGKQSYQPLSQQVTRDAIYPLIDFYYPQNKLANNDRKITFLCQKMQQNDANAVKIFTHITDCLAYALMNLVHLYSPEKIVITSELLQAKEPFLKMLNQRLAQYLEKSEYSVEVSAGMFQRNSPLLSISPIKQSLYDGELMAQLTSLPNGSDE